MIFITNSKHVKFKLIFCQNSHSINFKSNQGKFEIPNQQGCIDHNESLGSDVLLFSSLISLCCFLFEKLFISIDREACQRFFSFLNLISLLFSKIYTNQNFIFFSIYPLLPIPHHHVVSKKSGKLSRKQQTIFPTQTTTKNFMNFIDLRRGNLLC